MCFEFDNEKFIDQTNQNYSLSNKILANQNVLFSYKNNFGVGDSLDFTISVVKDEYPKISVNQILDSVYNLVFLDGIISDDYGINSLKFKYEIFSNGKKTINEIKLTNNKENDQKFFF